MTTIETKIAELKKELAEIRAEMKDESISDERWEHLRNYRREIRDEIENLEAEAATAEADNNNDDEINTATNNTNAPEVDTANNTGNITGNSDNELTDREKFLAAKEEIKTTAGRYLGDGKFAQIWQRNNGFGWRNIAKKNAALILAGYGLTVNEYLAARKQWIDEEVARGAAQCAIYYQAQFLRDKIRRDRKASNEPMPALFPAEDDDDDDELIDEPEIAENVFIGQDGTNYIIRAKNINITVEDRKIKINGHVVAKYKTDAGVNAALKYVTDWRNNIANYKTFDINDWNTIFDDFDFTGGNEDKFVYIDDEPSPTDKVITPDEMLALVGTLETVNAAAPYGWQISYDGKSFPVEFNGKTVTTLDSLALTKVLPPDKFFEQFNPDVPPKEHYINERRKELDMLLDFRKFVEDDSDRLKTLTNLIEDVKREILNAELDTTEHPPDIEFDEHGDIIPWF